MPLRGCGPFGVVLNWLHSMTATNSLTATTYPTTVHRCTQTQAWGVACDPANALRVSLRLAELCPDARYWTWLEAEAIHPDTERHVPIALVIVPSGYTALVNRLSAKLLVRQYDMTMIQHEPVAA